LLRPRLAPAIPPRRTISRVQLRFQGSNLTVFSGSPWDSRLCQTGRLMPLLRRCFCSHQPMKMNASVLF
ncbi:MAG: hypothetical protein Q8N89_12930, partial [Azonexus sp.]|nr:hypothetical protein [Azonexus sp.]